MRDTVLTIITFGWFTRKFLYHECLICIDKLNGFYSVKDLNSFCNTRSIGRMQLEERRERKARLEAGKELRNSELEH